ncbi:D-glycero-beta-D-manno-heptose 1,7-bisphosphate 7-phosphatase [Thiocystis violascens]|uniref:D,D-heptose 1,7-bisphosphate phosphatase n=1 Tax=Thiocystis violascens (strain ATCC 17096 / DSM 198 / 6111) TaxID=765911 RepID=I3YCM8_THIV6|nr:D-glycero-beta-D-manno-heptose 1,7-bisphosphate 7-phosphatase [Thiocystis violascens]AFL74746.1 histidinol-phosphate phosphatase family protein [Thiocystis violascens DSM 198]
MTRTISSRVLILDRDGVINEDSDAYIKSPDEWIPLPGSIDAIARLTYAGYRIAIATNQSGVARGLLSLSDLNTMHQFMRDVITAQGGRIEMIAFCPHSPDENCQCRKPKSGLLEEIAKRMNVDLTGVPFVGDTYSDLCAARLVGAAPYLVMTGKGTLTLNRIQQQDPIDLLQDVRVFQDLGSVANRLLLQQGRS